jgi:hypothetical protein
VAVGIVGGGTVGGSIVGSGIVGSGALDGGTNDSVDEYESTSIARVSQQSEIVSSSSSYRFRGAKDKHNIPSDMPQFFSFHML